MREIRQRRTMIRRKVIVEADLVLHAPFFLVLDRFFFCLFSPQHRGRLLRSRKYELVKILISTGQLREGADWSASSGKRTVSMNSDNCVLSTITFVPMKQNEK